MPDRLLQSVRQHGTPAEDMRVATQSSPARATRPITRMQPAARRTLVLAHAPHEAPSTSVSPKHTKHWPVCHRPLGEAVPARGQTPGQTLGKPWANPLHFGANPTPDGQARAQKCCPAWQRQVRVIPTNLPLYKSKRPDATKPSLLRSPASLRALPQSCCHCSLDFYSPSLLRSPASLR